MHNQLVRDGIEVISEETDFVHVSGHPNRDDLKDMYKWIKPMSVIPVHGEQRHMLEHIKFAKEMSVPYPIKVENGDIVRLYPGKSPEVYDKAPYGKILIDGNIGVDEDAKSIKERRNLASNGFLNITIIIGNKGEILESPVIYFKGLPIIENEKFRDNLKDTVENIIKTFSLKNVKQDENLIETLKIGCRKLTKEKTGKKPVTNINLVRV